MENEYIIGKLLDQQLIIVNKKRKGKIIGVVYTTLPQIALVVLDLELIGNFEKGK